MTPSADEGPDPLDESLRTLLDDDRRQAAAAARRRTHHLQAQAASSTDLRGLLVDLAAGQRPVVLATAADRELAGTVVAVSADHTTLRLAAGEQALVPLAAVASVRTAAGTAPALGGTTPRGPWGLAEALAELAEQRTDVGIRDRTGRSWRGRLVGSGRDLVVVLAAEHPPSYVHLPHAAITEVVAR